MSLQPIEKVNTKFARDIGVGTVAGALGTAVANQFPQNQKRYHLKKKDKVKKNLVPIIKSDNPDFNYDMAQKVYNIIMKMDVDEARLYAQMVVGDALEEDIEKNRRTLQRHLEDVSKRRVDRVKRALVAKAEAGGQDALAYAQALTKIEKAYQNPYATGHYRFKESDFRRNAGTGQFQAKVTHNPNIPHMRDDAARDGLGIDLTKDNYSSMSPALKSQYQQEYRQIANFLNSVRGSGDLGDKDVNLVLRDKRTGDQYYKQLPGNITLNPADSEVIGVEAKPAPGTLNLGGAAFGLIPSLNGDATSTIGRADDNFKSFHDDWTSQANNYDARATNSQLYGRVGAGAKFVGDVAPTGSHLQIAARMAQVVGDHGAEAEKVFGPKLRLSAYRYRGTEKQPDAKVIEDYAREIRGAQGRQTLRSERARQPGGYMTPDQRSELRSRQAEARTQAAEEKYVQAARGAEGSIPQSGHRFDEETQREVRTSNVPTRPKLTLAESSAINARVAREYAEEIKPKDNAPPLVGVEAGRAVLFQHLKENFPQKSLYGLQLDSGNTPPSEGFLIDSKGQIRAQAIGYGDDHYLPFNLKHLQSLKGGEYIRTRSVGGPTSEDIYTGLMTGARRLTVMSRSGTYTVEFQDDFRGGRRYNDKAKRMTRRYEQILDSVQSENVERTQPIDPEVRRHFAEVVSRDYAGIKPTRKRELVAQKIKEYKDELQMTVGEKEDFEAYLEEQSSGMPEGQRNSLRARMMHDWQSNNEFKFKLNGDGYRDALYALHEQFPYYLKKPNYVADPELDKISRENDKGYVEPGRNRPTEANAGWHGTADRLKGMGNAGTGRISASQVNYQRGLYGGGHSPTTPQAAAVGTPAATPGAPATPGANGTPTTPQTPEQRAQDQLEAIRARQAFAPVALEVANKIKAGSRWQLDRGLELLKFMDKPDDQLEAHFRTAEGVADMEKLIAGHGGDMVRLGVINQGDIVRIRAATGQTARQAYAPHLQLQYAGPPQKFPDPAYQPNAPEAVVNDELARLSEFKAITGNKRIIDMSDGEIKHELGVMRSVLDIKPALKDLDIDTQKRELALSGAISNDALKLLDDDTFTQHAENLQRVRALNEHRPTPPASTITETTTTPGIAASATDTVEHNRKEMFDIADDFDRAAIKLRSLGQDREALKFVQARDVLQNRANDDEFIDDGELQAMHDEIDELHEEARGWL